MLEGKNVNLRIVEKEDLPLIAEWLDNPDFFNYAPFPQRSMAEFEKQYYDLPSDSKWFRSDRSYVGTPETCFLACFDIRASRIRAIDRSSVRDKGASGLDLRGKTLIVTGASRGIGRALALELAQNGVNLVLNARSATLLEEVAAAARGKSVKTLTVVGDAALASKAQKMVKAAVNIGEFVGFIHNAGTLHPGPFLHELPQAMFEDVWRSNVLAGYQIAHFSYPELRRRKDSLGVFFGSGAAEMNLEGIGAYCLSKGAEEHLARQLAAEVPEITCFVYRPPPVEGEMHKSAREAKGSGAKVLHRVFGELKEQGTLLTPETAARALVQIIRKDPRRFHGKIATYKDGL